VHSLHSGTVTKGVQILYPLSLKGLRFGDIQRHLDPQGVQNLYLGRLCILPAPLLTILHIIGEIRVHESMNTRRKRFVSLCLFVFVCPCVYLFSLASLDSLLYGDSLRRFTACSLERLAMRHIPARTQGGNRQGITQSPHLKE